MESPQQQATREDAEYELKIAALDVYERKLDKLDRD